MVDSGVRGMDVKIIKKDEREQQGLVSEQKNDTICSEARLVELQKIRRELLTLAQRVERLVAA